MAKQRDNGGILIYNTSKYYSMILHLSRIQNEWR